MRLGAEPFTLEIHCKLITAQQLEQRLRDLLPPGTFNVEMKHNIYYIYVQKMEHARIEDLKTVTESLRVPT